MKDVIDFITAALPWVAMAMAIIVAGTYAKAAKEKDK